MTAVPGLPVHTEPVPRLVDQFEAGLAAPICLTWELTYACNLACVHCLSSPGRRDPRELTTAECKAVIDTLQRMQVFYVNIGGGEPTVRPDFWELVDYATAHQVGVKFSTNGVKIDPGAARRLAASDYVDVQVSLDGRPRRSTTRCAAPGPMPPRSGRWTISGPPGSPASSCRRW
jgi:mycofactocin biosynthetic radical S-adenosylmethionine protein MftC